MRKENWQQRLDTFLTARRNTPFAWGENDCCLSVADAVKAMTGIDIGSEYRGTPSTEPEGFTLLKYCTEEEGLALLAQVTGIANASVEDAMDHACTQHDFLKPLTSVSLAQRGDVVSILIHEQIILGIVGLNGMYAHFVSDGGLLRVPVLRCKRAWRVK